MASTGLTIGLIKALAGIDPSALEEALAEYLAEHPEALQTDVQINGTSITDDGVANIPQASGSTLGVVNIARDADVKSGESSIRCVPTNREYSAVFYGLAKAANANMASIQNTTVGTYPEAQKSAISDMLNAPESVSGSTPSITAKSGVRYICGECSTLTITVPESGIIDVVFESGSTPTVLTVTSAKSGVSAIKWIGADDPTALEANKTYEINILDGEFGVIASWT